MDELSGVLLDVDAGDADPFGAGGGLNIQVAVFAQRQVVLGNLVGFRQVGVEVVFPVLFGAAGDGAAGGKAGLDRVFDHLAV